MEGLMKRTRSILGCLLIGFCILSVCGMAEAETFCVRDAIELQNALTTAESNEEDDIIQVRQGAYHGSFTYSSIDGDSITLLGAYTPGCVTRVVDPSNTLLDGMGSDNVLYLYNINGGDIFVEGFTLQNGDTSGNGGGIYALSSSASDTAGDITLRGNIIRENTAHFGGGGVSALSLSHLGSAGKVTLTDNTITDNTGYPGLGGGVYAYSSGGTESGDVTLSGNTITGNTVECSGGGVFAVSSARTQSGRVILTHNTIVGNTSGHVCGGGGISAYSSSLSGIAGDVIITNNVISDNLAYSGGGVQAYSSGAAQSGNVILTNNTVTGNAADFGGGLYLLIEENGNSIYNSIIWGNWASIVGGDIGLERLSAGGTVSAYNNDYSDLSGTWTNSENNIDQDPLFVDPENGDLHIRADSPCIDAGTNEAPELSERDIDGDPRIVEGRLREAPTVDIGADEYAAQMDVFSEGT